MRTFSVSVAMARGRAPSHGAENGVRRWLWLTTRNYASVCLPDCESLPDMDENAIQQAKAAHEEETEYCLNPGGTGEETKTRTQIQVAYAEQHNTPSPDHYLFSAIDCPPRT